VLEAMASRLPVVGVQSEGVCDLVRDGYTGYLLDASGLDEKEQAQEYRARLELLVYNSELRHSMGGAGHMYARECTWSSAMQKLLDGYEEVISGKRPLVAA
jgi:glycosyltransferase involved in cell wall biosynthesis